MAFSHTLAKRCTRDDTSDVASVSEDHLTLIFVLYQACSIVCVNPRTAMDVVVTATSVVALAETGCRQV